MLAPVIVRGMTVHWKPSERTWPVVAFLTSALSLALSSNNQANVSEGRGAAGTGEALTGTERNQVGPGYSVWIVGHCLAFASPIKRPG